jgi:hypothetical protein
MLKRLIFILAMLALIWLGLEVIGMAGHVFLNSALFPKSKIEQDIRGLLILEDNEEEDADEAGIAGLDWEGYEFVEAVHPYFGYVPDPFASSLERYAITPLGFIDPIGDLPLPRRAPDQIVIGFFGGSFAMGTTDLARPGLAKCLEFTGKNIVVRNYSAGGYKQPQQLHIFADLLASGAEFDVVINLDGFNEVALPIAENLPAGVHPFFPRRWHDRVAQFISPARTRKVGAIELLEENRRHWAAAFHSSKLYRSPALALVWQIRDRDLDKRIFELRESLRLADESELQIKFQQSGPAFPSDENAVYAQITQMWKGASIQMANLAAGNDTHYLHFLQPNQYVEGSKPMSSQEREAAIMLEHAYRPTVVKGYPLLIEAGHELQREGIDYFDLTQIYSDEEEPLYVDSCCHVNARGYEIVVEELCRTVIAALSE